MNFWGYLRPNGQVGVRNHVAILPSVICATGVARRIAAQVEGTVAVEHVVGCSQVGFDLEITARTLKNLGRHPNAAAVLVVGLGCERLKAEELAEDIAQTGKPVEICIIQDSGGSLKAVEAGSSIARKLVQKFSTQRREQFGVEHLAIATECGGTDAFSGIVANPAVGIASDLVVANGGTVMISEVTELLGTEHLLAARAVNQDVADQIYKVIGLTEEMLGRASTNDRSHKRLALISPGNVDGGVTTVVEKSLGGAKKAGSSPIVGVLKYGERYTKHGLHLMDTPGQDGESTTGMVAGGCQIVLFTTGRGTPTGHPLAPVIKVTGNSHSYKLLQDNIDINTGTVVDGSKTLREAGEDIFREVLEVASGKRTKAEVLGHDELMTVWRPTSEHELAYGCGEWA
ncbi:MAG TPA: UxaA family hydrolase [Chloroflexota bacterium]|nr:UxaA family hydrolase [Chloroflexota bacterium]